MSIRRKHLKGMIFDIDGTLVDSNEAHALAWRDAFQQVGRPFSLQEIRPHIGKGGDLLVPDLLNAREMRAISKSVRKTYSRIFRSSYRDGVKPFGDVGAVFRALRERGVAIVLASSSDPQDVEFFIDLLGVKELIDGNTSKKDADHSKPSPEIFESALELIGTGDLTFIVGDTPYDVVAAHRASTPVAAVLSGGFSREELKMAEFLFQDVHSVLKGLDKLDDYFNE